MAKVKKYIELYTKFLAVWVLAGAVAAYLAPGFFVRARAFLNYFFAVTMFGIGAVLTIEDFKRIARSPVAVFIGTAAQYTIMPLGAFFTARVFGFSPELTLGLVLTGSAPGAMASNVISYIAGADVAYSVSLTSVSTLLSPVMTPGYTYALANSVLKVDFWPMFSSVVSMVILPVFAGIGVRHLLAKKFGNAIDGVISVFPAISATFIVFICALVVALNKATIARMTAKIFLAVIVLNAVGMSLGYLVGKITRMDVKKRRTLSIEVGMQNAGLGTVLALKHFSPETAVPAAVFMLLCIFTASLTAEWWRGLPGG